jgi:ERCC4-type nuclease
MKLKLKIDVREGDLFTCCKMIVDRHVSKDLIELTSVPLPIGDIIISDAITDEDKVIVERKTLVDLAASIKDGRYAEQSYRLNGLNHPNHNIIYLIEGDLTKLSIFKSKLDKQTLYSAMFSINYYKGFSLMRSNTLEESATILCNMLFKLVKSDDKQPYYTQQQQQQQQQQQMPSEEVNDYCSVVKRVKKENVTKQNISNIMLCQIPSISDVTATAVFKKFNTMSDLIVAIREDPTCLNDIKTTMANGKSRKISKACIKNIIDFL